jgi:hypothetical protein
MFSQHHRYPKPRVYKDGFLAPDNMPHDTDHFRADPPGVQFKVIVNLFRFKYIQPGSLLVSFLLFNESKTAFFDKKGIDCF